MREGIKVLMGLMALAVGCASPSLAKTVDLRNLPLDAQNAMLKTCRVDDGRIEARHLECLDYHARAWRKLMFKPDLDRLSLRSARKLREACESASENGPAPWARCVEEEMVERKIAVTYPDLSRLTRPLRNRARQVCESAAKVSPYRESACLTKLRDRFLENPPPQASTSPMSQTNARQGDSSVSENVRPARTTPDRRVAVLTPGVLNFNALNPADPFWPGWRGVRPVRPVVLRDRRALQPHEIYRLVSGSVYVVLGAASADDLRAARDVRQGSAVAISESHLATNCHVLKGANVIVLLQGEENGRARLINSHPATDRCLLESEDMVLQPAPGIRPFDDLQVGEKVWSIAAPHGLQQSLHDGIVSQLRSNNGVPLIQTSAHAAPGSSGGGLFDAAGNLVGITNFTIAEDTRLHFAIAAGSYWE